MHGCICLCTGPTGVSRCQTSTPKQIGQNKEEFKRIGEAKNPGPPVIRSGVLNPFHCNPTQLYNRENDIARFGEGIVFFPETSATKKNQSIIQKRLALKGYRVKWSPPVEPYQSSTSELRGLAGGSAIAATFPITPVLTPLPSDIARNDRYAECFVQYAPGQNLLAIAVYGPTRGPTFHNPEDLRNRIIDVAAQRALQHAGPTCIVGDFNTPLSQVQAWGVLRQNGWVDAAELSMTVNGDEEEMTCEGRTRHSFFLLCPRVARHLLQCRTVNHHLSSAHPVIKAQRYAHRIRYGNYCVASTIISMIRCWPKMQGDNFLKTTSFSFNKIYRKMK